MQTYGERIAFLREKHGLTQEELAHKIGITRAALSHYETNRRKPDYETIEKFADLFRVSVDYLLGRKDHPHAAIDDDYRDFIESLELSDERILEMFTLTVDGEKLTREEAKGFIQFIRAKRSDSKFKSDDKE